MHQTKFKGVKIAYLFHPSTLLYTFSIYHARQLLRRECLEMVHTIEFILIISFAPHRCDQVIEDLVQPLRQRVVCVVLELVQLPAARR